MAASAIILYHYPCQDGAFAALAAWRYHKIRGIPMRFLPQTVFNPLKVDDVISIPHKKDALYYFLDYSGPKGFVRELAPFVNRIIVLDHHKTALEDLCDRENPTPPNVELVIDMDRSGAMIAKDYFSLLLNEAIPDQALFDDSRMDIVYSYIQDRDLWTRKLPRSEEFSSGLASMKLEFDFHKNPGNLDVMVGLNPEIVCQKGAGVLSENGKLISQCLLNTFVLNLGGIDTEGKARYGQCLGVYLESFALAGLRSEIGNRLATLSMKQDLRAIGAVVYVEPDMSKPGSVKVSLRSQGDEDTTKISQAFGGGGHLNASSFLLPADLFAEWRIQ